mmetsp:Transcript_44093/g.134265  ORF Transcript_44093/g.134265 Transcript_44093/m.134265 type:complete len:299 (-) Transcript_44093:2517-3413(-)
MCAKSERQNDDWVATCEIFDPQRSTAVFQDTICGGPLCEIDISIQILNTVFIQLISSHKTASVDEEHGAKQLRPRWAYRTLCPSNAPVFKVIICYSADNAVRSVSISSTVYPVPWPREALEPWLEWLNQEATKALCASGISYSACEFIEHRGLDFFNIVHDEGMGFIAVVCSAYSLGGKPPGSMNTSGAFKLTPRSHITDEGSAHCTALDRFALEVISSRWREWVKTECPICFSDVVVAKAIELNCKHIFCSTCLRMFAKTEGRGYSHPSSQPIPMPCCVLQTRYGCGCLCKAIPQQR